MNPTILHHSFDKSGDNAARILFDEGRQLFKEAQKSAHGLVKLVGEPAHSLLKSFGRTAQRLERHVLFRVCFSTFFTACCAVWAIGIWQSPEQAYVIGTALGSAMLLTALGKRIDPFKLPAWGKMVPPSASVEGLHPGLTEQGQGSIVFYAVKSLTNYLRLPEDTPLTHLGSNLDGNQTNQVPVMHGSYMV